MLGTPQWDFRHCDKSRVPVLRLEQTSSAGAVKLYRLSDAVCLHNDK